MSHMQRIADWVQNCFGTRVLYSNRERVSRVVEEAIEFAQAQGLEKEMVKRIMERVYSRPAGDPRQEASGVWLTMLAWAFAEGCDPDAIVEAELQRIEAIDPEHFRKKHAAKVAAGTGL